MTLLLVGVLGGAGWVTWVNFQSAADWRAQAKAAREDVEALAEENDTLENDLDELGDALDRSEADVRELERQLSRTADLKARAEDEREAANAYAERVTEVAVAYDGVAQWFQSCMDAQAELTSLVFDIEYLFRTGQEYLVDSQIDRVGETCGTAEQRLAELRSYVQDLAP